MFRGKIFYGIKTVSNKVFVISEETRKRLVEEDPKNKELIKPFLLEREIKRYQLPKKSQYLIMIPKGGTNKNNDSKENA